MPSMKAAHESTKGSLCILHQRTRKEESGGIDRGQASLRLLLKPQVLETLTPPTTEGKKEVRDFVLTSQDLERSKHEADTKTTRGRMETSGNTQGREAEGMQEGF